MNLRSISSRVKNACFGATQRGKYSGCWNSVYFHHIAKTAGISYRSWLDGFFSQSEICPHGGMDRNVLATDLDRYRFFAGHFPITFASMLPGPCGIITVLRDPEATVLSRYNHLCRLGSRHMSLGHRRGRPVESFDDFLNDDVLRTAGSNNQTFSLGWRPPLPEMLAWTAAVPELDWHAWEGVSVNEQNWLRQGKEEIGRHSDELLKSAAETLRNDIIACGLVEFETESLALIRSVLGVPGSARTLARLNSAAGEKKSNPLLKRELSEAQRSALKEMTLLDDKLYGLAKGMLFERSKSLLPSSVGD